MTIDRGEADGPNIFGLDVFMIFYSNNMQQQMI